VGRPLKIGIHLPEIERIARWRDLRTMVERAEQLGFDSIWVPDHLLMRYPDQEPVGPWECWSILSAVAAVTSRVELGTLVIATSFRNPALTAKMADTVEEISGGRLILGVGAGWHKPEYEAFGFPYDHRVSRFEEALQIIHGLLREGQIDFDGHYYQARECELRPRGPRPQGPPLLIGTTSPRMLGLTARYADLWNAWSRNRPEEIAPLRETVDAACRAEGRDPATLARTVSVHVDLPGHERAPDPKHLTGTPEQMAATLSALAAEGISHVQIILDPNTAAAIEQFAPVLELLDAG
jgi:probable F420-dependent oxidoreductase